MQEFPPPHAPSPRRLLPVGLDVAGALCVVVGGGPIGARKARNLSSAGAMVTVVAPDVCPGLADQIAAGEIRWIQEKYRADHLDHAFVVVAATHDRALNQAIARAGTQAGALVCNASSADDSRLIFGAIHEHDGVTIAVFSHGRDPSLSKQTRNRIAGLLAEPSNERTQP